MFNHNFINVNACACYFLIKSISVIETENEQDIMAEIKNKLKGLEKIWMSTYPEAIKLIPNISEMIRNRKNHKIVLFNVLSMIFASF